MTTTTVHGRPAIPIIGALLLAAISFALLQTMVFPVVPEIAKDYGTSHATATWVLTGFLLSASVCTPLAGKLGDLFGKARVLTAVLVIFSVGSVVAALAGSIELLIAARVIQGVAGGVFPLSFGIINDELPSEHRAGAIGLMSAMFGIGGGIGLPLAGVIVDNADLSWLFVVGLLALPAAFAVWRLVPPSPPRGRTQVDWRGAAVLSAGLVAVLLAITKANQWGWSSPRFLALLATGAIVLALFVVLEQRTEHPLVDIRVLRRRPVWATNLSAFMIGIAMFGSFLLIPQFTQTAESSGYGFGYSVTAAGLVLLPSSAMMLIAGPFGGVLGHRLGFRTLLAVGTIFAGASFALLAITHSHVWSFLAAGVLMGLGISLSFGAMANLVVAAVDPRDVGISTGINTIMRTIGGAFGSALVAALLSAETIPGSGGTPTEGAYTEAFALSAGGALLALAATLAIPRLRDRAEPPVAPEPVAAPAEPVLARHSS